MRYDDPSTELLFISFKEWCLERRLPIDETVFEKLGTYVHAHGGYEPALSLWDRAAIEVGIKLTPRPKPTPIPANFQDQLNALTPGQLRSKITPPAGSAHVDQHDLRAERVRDRAADGYDLQFADWFNRWSDGERPEGLADREPELTAQMYHSIPAATICRKYTGSADFRRQVDSLIQRGLI